MHNNSHELELVILIRVLELDFWHGLIIDACITSCLSLLSFTLLLLLLIEIVLCVLPQIDVILELKERVQLLADHLIKVEVKALQRHYQIARQLFKTLAFQGIDFSVTPLAVILVLLVEDITCDIGTHTLFKTLLILDWDSKREERFLTRVLMWARLTDDLIGELATEVILNGLLLGCAFDGRLKAIHEHCEVLFNIHLLEDVCWLAFPVLERIAVVLGVDVHFLGQEESCEESLPLKEHVVLVSVLIVVRVFD